MRKLTPVYWIVFMLLVLVLTQPVYAAPDVPPGFKLVTSAPGVQLYRKDYQNGTPDFVQVIELSQGATIVPQYGTITETRAGKGSYGGPDPRFRSKPLSKYWQELNANSSNAFCVSNGQFFYMKESPTRLPFPLRVDNQVVSDGYGLRDFSDQKLLLLLWPGKADIVPLEKDTLYGTSAPHAITGLAEDARKSPTKYVGRTFVGVDDRDGDGVAEIVLVFSTHSARQKDAASVLRSFGADKVMMFDGGGSAQLTCQGNEYVASERPIPQAIGVLAAPDDFLPSTQIVNESTHDNLSMVEVEEQITGEYYLAEKEAAPTEVPTLTAQVVLISEQSPIYAFKLEDVVWVPVVMAPAMAVVLLALVRKRLSV